MQRPASVQAFVRVFCCNNLTFATTISSVGELTAVQRCAEAMNVFGFGGIMNYSVLIDSTYFVDEQWRISHLFCNHLHRHLSVFSTLLTKTNYEKNHSENWTARIVCRLLTDWMNVFNSLTANAIYGVWQLRLTKSSTFVVCFYVKLLATEIILGSIQIMLRPDTRQSVPKKPVLNNSLMLCIDRRSINISRLRIPCVRLDKFLLITHYIPVCSICVVCFMQSNHSSLTEMCSARCFTVS